MHKIQVAPEQALAEGFFGAAAALGLGNAELMGVLGLSRSALGRLKQSGAIDPHSKTGEIAMLLIRIYRSLVPLNGGDSANIQHFMQTPNRHLGGRPAELIQRLDGLAYTCAYLDALRGAA
ncbi:MbcA/ParS/Xre antitoxin family protein [Microbulbifer sp. SAOS-129_SWC]|uniref:MbcA/ParS/Xre antitoxin family protein n=1 Tax=Microbulbifer sp. SAOS-129_SWC TaxID=3145235 RepID=UPI003217CA9B